MEKLMKYLYEDKSKEMLYRIFSKKEHHYMSGIWSGTAYKMVK